MKSAAAILAGCLLLAASTAAAADKPARERDALEVWRGVTVTEISLAGNHVTKSWVIAREIWTEEGHSLDPQTVREDVIRLENLAIFGSVEVTARTHAGGVALDFVFTEMPWIIPYPSLAYTEENGFSVGLGVASPNFRGRHVNLSALARFGGANVYRFKGGNPWITGNHVSAGFEAYHQGRRNKLVDFQQTEDFIALDGGKYIGRHGRLKATAGFYGVGSDRSGVTLNPRDYDNLWNTSLSVGHDSRDSWRVPHEGWHNELQAHYYGGDADFVAVDLDVVRYQPLAGRHTVATGPLLSLQSGHVDQHIPVYMQYFMGGTNSIRGYRLEELGQEIYGKNQLLYNLEYRYLLMPVRGFKVFKWSIGVGLQAAAFADVGVAWSRRVDLNLDRTRFGYGAGLRLLLPGVEMLRFDMGASETGTIVFNFGVDSMFVARRLRVR